MPGSLLRNPTMKINVYNLKAENVGKLNLATNTYNLKSNEQLVSQAIRVFLSNQRQGTAKAKNRNEVHGTTKKVWAQKGTGRARHGSRKAPIFVGGGVTHGPTGEQNFSLKLSKKMITKAKKLLLTKLALNKSLIAIDKMSNIEPKTKVASTFLTGLKADFAVLSKSKKIAVLTAGSQPSVKRAFKNIPSVTILNLKSLNVFDLASTNILIATTKAINLLAK